MTYKIRAFKTVSSNSLRAYTTIIGNLPIRIHSHRSSIGDDRGRDGANRFYTRTIPEEPVLDRATEMEASAEFVGREVPEVSSSLDPPSGDLLSPGEVAAQYGVPTQAITRTIETGALPYWSFDTHGGGSATEVEALARAHAAA